MQINNITFTYMLSRNTVLLFFFSCSYPSGQPVHGTLVASVTLVSLMHNAASPVMQTQTKEVRFDYRCSSFLKEWTLQVESWCL